MNLDADSRDVVSDKKPISVLDNGFTIWIVFKGIHNIIMPHKTPISKMGILGFSRDAWVIGDHSVQFIAVYITTVDELYGRRDYTKC